MKSLRLYVLPSVIAGMICAVPFATAVSLRSVFASGHLREEVDWLGALASFAISDLLAGVFPLIFYFLARRAWIEEESVARRHLYGWPIGIGILCCVAMLLATVLSGMNLVGAIICILFPAAVVIFGLMASRIWLRLSYR